MKTSAKELREMGREAIIALIDKSELDLAKLKEAVMTGKEKNHTKLQIMKRDVARAKTVLNELNKQ